MSGEQRALMSRSDEQKDGFRTDKVASLRMRQVVFAFEYSTGANNATAQCACTINTNVQCACAINTTVQCNRSKRPNKSPIT